MELYFFDVGEIAHIDREPPDIPPDIDNVIDKIVIFVNEHQRNSTPIFSHPTVVQPKSRDYESLRPLFLQQYIDVIKRTFEANTQFARTKIGILQLKNTFKNSFPACNVHRHNEAVATDTAFSDVPAIDDGYTVSQIFEGREILVADVYGIATEK